MITNISHPKEQIIPNFENGFKAVFIIVLLVLSLTVQSVAAVSLSKSEVYDVVIWTVCGLLGVFNAVLIIGLAVLAHEAVHNVLFRSRFWNDFIGGLLSATSLIPFYANRQFHLSHHSYAHQEGLDPECHMHQKGYLFAFFIGPHVGLLLQQFIFLRNLVSFRVKGMWRGVKDAFFLSCALGFYALLVNAGIQFKFALLPTMLAFPIVFSYRAMSDHYGLPRVKRKSERRKDVIEQSELMNADYTKNQATGWVVFTHPLVEWLWSHVNYHDVHHKYPYLSHIHLKAAYAASKDKQEYQTVRGFGANLRNLWGKAYFS